MELGTVRAGAQALTRAGVKCLFAGGVAVAAHGCRRTTHGIAIVAQPDRKDILRAAGEFGGPGDVPRVPAARLPFAGAALRGDQRFHLRLFRSFPRAGRIRAAGELVRLAEHFRKPTIGIDHGEGGEHAETRRR